MGEMAEYYINRMQEGFDPVTGKITLYQRVYYKYMWTMKNGERIAVKDMTTSHIQNCINLLKRRKELYKGQKDKLDVLEHSIKVFEKELKSRG